MRLTPEQDVYQIAVIYSKKKSIWNRFQVFSRCDIISGICY